MVAAYIDLNAVRAGIVKEPKEWRWCGYAEAAAAQSLARNGIYEVLGEAENPHRGGVGCRRFTSGIVSCSLARAFSYAMRMEKS